MEPEESLDLSNYVCEHCNQPLQLVFGKLTCDCYEVGLYELMIGYHQKPPFWIEKEPGMSKEDKNRVVPINDDYFSRFYDQNARKAIIEGHFHGPLADRLAECKKLLEEPLSDGQKRWYHACHELFSPNIRGTGRTYAMLTSLVMTALQNPNRSIYIIDHHPLYNEMNRQAVLRTLDEILNKLPADIHKQIVLSARGQSLSIVFRLE